MPSDRVIRAVDHPYRRNILHILARGALTYSQLFASMEPRGGGRGRFNYHLKVLREAGLIQAQENRYGLSEIGEAAVSFLEGVNKDSSPRTGLNLPRRHVGPLLGFSILGLASALLLWSVLAPLANLPPVQSLEVGWGVPTSIETSFFQTSPGGEGILRHGIRELTAVVDNSDNGFVVWKETETIYSPGKISESRLLHTAQFVPGIGWGEINSYDTPWEGSSNPRIAVEKTGSIFALWGSSALPNGASEVYASRLIPSRGWTDSALLDRRESSNVIVHEIAASSSGRAIATWAVDGKMYASSHSDRGWESPARFGPSEDGYVDIVMSPTGDAMAIWAQAEDEGEWGLWASFLHAATGWGTPVLIGPHVSPFPGSWSGIPVVRSDQVGITPSGEAFVAFVAPFNGTQWIHVNRYVPSFGWGQPTPIATNVSNYAFDYLSKLALVVDDRGDAVAVWKVSNEWGDGPIFGSRYVRETEWAAPQLIESNASSLCALEGTGDSDVILLWRSGESWGESSGHFVNSFTPETGWTDRESVGMSPPYGCPQLAVGPTGNAFVVWVDRSYPQREIWANYFARPQSLEDLVGDVGYLLDRANARLAGLELRFLLLAGVIVALVASSGIFLSLYWYQRRGLASHTESEEEPDEPPRTSG